MTAEALTSRGLQQFVIGVITFFGIYLPVKKEKKYVCLLSKHPVADT